MERGYLFSLLSFLRVVRAARLGVPRTVFTVCWPLLQKGASFFTPCANAERGQLPEDRSLLCSVSE